MQKHVKEYKMYQNYLETVVNESEEFQSLADIFNRYESLVESRLDLAQHQDQSLEALEIAGSEMVRYRHYSILKDRNIFFMIQSV